MILSATQPLQLHQATGAAQQVLQSLISTDHEYSVESKLQTQCQTQCQTRLLMDALNNPLTAPMA